MTRWPPILWLCIAGGGLLLLVGWNGTTVHPLALAAGIVLILTGAGASVWAAFGRWGDRPQVGGIAWLIPATVGFFVVFAVAGLLAGTKYAVAAIAAGLIPFTAATALTATARSKTVSQDGRRRETTRAASDDPLPGIGADDATPLGDTTEHSDAERVASPDDRFEAPGRTRAQ
jgi:membrane-bound ClpP family serine protease